MPAERIYTIRNSRLKRACFRGFSIQGDSLKIDGMQKASCYLAALDGAADDCGWGRVHIEASLNNHMHLQISAMACNQKRIEENGEIFDIEKFLTDKNIENQKKEELFEFFHGIRAENQRDCLLYSLKGRYLWIAIIVEGEGNGEIQEIKIYQNKDSFMDIFPEIYREQNSFFHRYLSIFSAVYQDFWQKTEHVYELFDPDTAPAELLPELAGWMGIDVKGDFLNEKALRTLVREAYTLNKYKGTRRSLERVIEIVLGERAVIKEKCRQKKYEAKEQAEDIVILIKTEVEERKKSRLLFLLEQFKPVKCSMQIIFLKKGGSMDGHTYTDINAMIEDKALGYLDNGQTYQNFIIK